MRRGGWDGHARLRLYGLYVRRSTHHGERVAANVVRRRQCARSYSREKEFQSTRNILKMTLCELCVLIC